MSLLDGCLVDTLSNPSSIDSFDYYIDVTGLRVIPTPSYTQEVANCEVSWSLITVEDGYEGALSATQANYVQLQNDGSINVDLGGDKSVKTEIWNFKLKATSDLSTLDSDRVAEYEFSISLLDGCIYDELSSPSSIDDFDYYIDDTGLYEIPTPNYSQSVANC